MSLSSPYDGHGRAGLRVTLAAVLAFDTLLVSSFLLRLRPGPISHPGAPSWLLGIAGHPWAIAPIAIVAIASLVAFARRAAALLPGCVALVAVGLLVEAHAACIEGPYRIFFSGGAAMLGWLVGGGYARATGREPAQAERHAEFGAASALAATYLGAVTSKMMAGGLGWTDADSLRGMMLTQHLVSDSRLSNAYAALVADHAWLAGTLVTLTLIAQGSALAYPWHRVTRAVSGTLLIAFHANVEMLADLFFPQAMVLLLALSYPWPAIAERLVRSRRTGVASRAQTPAPAPAPTAPTRTARAVLLAAVVVGVLVAWVSPLRSYTLAHQHHGGGPSSERPPPVSAALARVLGELSPGAHVGSWEVRSVTGSPGGGARLDLVDGASRLHVLVVPHGSVPGDPPAKTRDYDVLYERERPDEAPVTVTDRTAAVEAVASSIRKLE